MTSDKIDTLKTTLGNLDATHISAEHAAAQYILNHLAGYRSNAKLSSQIADRKFLETALQAYAKLVQEYGVKI